MKNRTRFVVLSLLASMLFIGGCREQASNKKAQSTEGIRSVLISAHRGGPKTAFPENTLEVLKFTSRKIKGVMMEVDVRKTKDQVLVLMHDKSIDRTTTGKGLVTDLNYSELVNSFVRDADGNVTAFKVPKLEDVFNWLRSTEAFLSLDVKEKGAFAQVVDLINEYELKDQVEVITYSLEDALFVHSLDSRIHLSVTIRNSKELEKVISASIDPSRIAAFTGLSLKDSSFYARLKKEGMVVTLGTIGNLDRRAEARGLELYTDWQKLGVDRFATDFPLKVQQALE